MVNTNLKTEDIKKGICIGYIIRLEIVIEKL